MTLTTYIKLLQEIQKEYGNLNVIYSSDTEGNSFDEVFIEPSVGNYNNNTNEFDTDGPPNSVCIN